MISLQTALGSHASVYPGASQVDILPCLQNQTKPVTFDAESFCGAKYEERSWRFSERLGAFSPRCWRYNPRQIRLNTTSSPDFAGMVCQHCFMDVGCDFQILGDTGNFVPVCSACALFQCRQERQLSLQSVSRYQAGRTCNSHSYQVPSSFLWICLKNQSMISHRQGALKGSHLT